MNWRIFPAALAAYYVIGCSGTKSPFNGLTSPSQATNYSGDIIVSTITTEPATGPGLVTIFSPTGSVISTLRDFFSTGEWASGSGFYPPSTLYVAVEGTDRLESIDLQTNVVTPITNVQLSATPLRQIAVTSTGNVFVAESNQNTVERFSNGKRDGNPYIPTTVGSCVLSTPYGVAVNSANGDIAVVSSPGAAGRLSIYDSSGGCRAQITTGTIASGTPAAIAYHAPSGKYLIASATTHAIHAYDSLGATAELIYLNSSIINTPRAITTDANGFIYVGSSGTDTVEKLSWSGSGPAVRVGNGPLLGPGIFTQNPTSITVVP